MRRYPAFSRRELRARFKVWAARNSKAVVWLVAGTIALLAFETVVLGALWPSTPFRWYLLGFLHAGVVAVSVHLLSSTFLANDRDAILHMRGAWGEENTRSELARAKRKRHIWGWVDSVSLEQGDIDHLVVTRAGGLVAIDSKWRTDPGMGDREAMASAAHRAQIRAQAVVDTLLKADRGAHRAKAVPVKVTPLVVVWGPAQYNVPARAQVDGIDFVGGRQLREWFSQVEGDPVDRAAATDVIKRIEAFRESAWGSGTRPSA
jgi:hypothetical protein